MNTPRWVDKVWRNAVLETRGMLWGVYGRTRRTVTVRTQQGVLTVYCSDKIIGRKLYCQGAFELDLSQKVVALLGELGRPLPGGTVLDIGANMGVITIGLLRQGWMRRAIAIEPEPGNVALLRRNVTQNGLGDRVICVPCAVSDSPGVVAFELSRDNFGDHRVRLGAARVVDTPPPPSERYHESERHVIEVESRCLDDVLATLPPQFADDLALIWVDTQGHEAHVFRGARSVLSRGVPVVAELWPYGLIRAGVSRAEFCGMAEEFWSTYWVVRRGRFFPYPIALLGMLFDELGDSGDAENVVFTA
jgi:FkbM family methyltransferase